MVLVFEALQPQQVMSFTASGLPSTSDALSTYMHPPQLNASLPGVQMEASMLCNHHPIGMSAHSQHQQASWHNMQTTPGASGSLSERDIKTLKRKQANRDAARRSKTRRKQEAQALDTRLRQLKEDNESLHQEASALRSTLQELMAENEKHRELLAKRRISTERHVRINHDYVPPQLPVFRPPGPNGSLAGENTMISIPDVLEFSQHYLSQISRPLHSGSFTVVQACQAQPPSNSSSLMPIIPDRVTMGLSNPCDQSLFFDTTEAGCDEVVRCPDRPGRH